MISTEFVEQDGTGVNSRYYATFELYSTSVGRSGIYYQLSAVRTMKDNVASRGTRIGRITAYVREMFPPVVYVPAAAANFAAVYLGAQALDGRLPLRWTWRATAGVITTLLFLLLMRVYDELKDVETDLRLGKAGDPRFKDRAIVTGRIRLDDLVYLRWWLTGLLIAVNLPLGLPLPLAVFAIVFFLTWLSYHWFFWPAVSRNLLLAFVTHNPLSLALGAYVASVYVRDFGSLQRPAAVFVLLIAMWTSMAAWETARKIRYGPDETDYVTYSKLLGTRTAPLLPLFFVTISASCLVSIAAKAGAGWVYSAFVCGAAALLILACIRFQLKPSRSAANLRPYAELYSLVAYAGLPVALLFSLPVQLGSGN